MSKKYRIEILFAILILVIGIAFGYLFALDHVRSCQDFVTSSDKIVKIQMEIAEAQNDQLAAMGNLDVKTITAKSKEIDDLSQQIQDEAPNYKQTKEACSS